MNRQLFSNNGVSTLRVALTAGSASLLVETGHGARFPVIAEDGDWFMVTLINPSTGAIEIARATARAGDIINVTRAQEGTTALSLPAGATVDHRITKGTLENLAQKLDSGGVPEAPGVGGPFGRANRDWVALPAPGPASTIPAAQVDAIRAATAANGANRFTTIQDLAGAGGGGGSGLNEEIVAALMAAIAPSAGNPFATVANLSAVSGGGGGTVLADSIVNALNAAGSQSPGTTNPFAVVGQLPVTSVAVTEARLTMGALRALKVGSYVVPATTTPHPVLGTIPYAMLDVIFGTEIPMPVSVAAALVKDGRSYLLVLMQIDPITGTYSPSAYVWTDDNTLAVGINVNDPAQPKSVFRSTGQLVASAIATLDQQRLANQVKIDELRVDPSSLPASASDLHLSLLYEPYVVLEDPPSGANLFDGTSRYVKIAWKTGSAEPAVVAGKELFVNNGGTFGHLRDGLGGPFIQTDRVLRWLTEGRTVQVMRDTADANVGNLCVIQVMPLPGATGGQALTRDSRWGLISLAAAAVADYSLFRDGSVSGRLAYKMGGVTKYPLFEGDVATGGGGGSGSATIDSSPAPVTAGPLLYASSMAGQMIDLDLTTIPADGTLDVVFDGTLTTPPPLGQSYTTWFWVKGVSGTKRAKFQRLNVGAQMAAPPLIIAYRRATGITTAGFRSNPDGGGTSPGPVTRQTITVPIGTDTVVRFVFLILVRQILSALQPHTLGGLAVKEGAAPEQILPWDVIYESAVGISPTMAVLDYDLGDVDDPTDLTIYPKFTDVDTTVFSNVVATIGFAFILSSSQINGQITAVNQQYFGSLDNWSPTVDNTANLSRAVYILGKRGNAGDFPMTVSGTTANLLGTGACASSAPSMNSSEMRWIVGEEVAVTGQNGATFLCTGGAGWASAYSMILSPLGTNDLTMEGPSEVAANNQLVPVIYDHHRRRVRICA